MGPKGLITFMDTPPCARKRGEDVAEKDGQEKLSTSPAKTAQTGATLFL